MAAAVTKKGLIRDSLTRAVEVQSASTNINRLSNPWRQLLSIPGSSDLFICKAQKGHYHQGEKYVRDSPSPPIRRRDRTADQKGQV